MKIFLLIVFLYIVSLSNDVFASPDPHWIPPEKENLSGILDHIYNLEFKEAEEKIAAYQADYPWRPEGHFAEGMVLWMKVLADLYNPELDSRFISKMDEIIDHYNQVSEKDSLYVVTKFYKSAAIGFKARLYVNRSKWFNAALTGVKAISGIMDALEGEYPNVDAKLGTGLYLYYAAIVPDKYPFAIPFLIFYPSGDRERGLADLKETSEKGLFARTEARYIYAQTLFLYEKKYYQAYRIMDSLIRDYPANPVFLRWHAAMAYSVGFYSKALESMNIYEKRIREGYAFYQEHQLRLVYYRKGLIAQRQKKWPEALEFYDMALEPLPGKIEKEMERYRVMSTINKAYCLRRLGRKEEALRVYEKVLREPDIDGTHTRAREAIKALSDH